MQQDAVPSNADTAVADWPGEAVRHPGLKGFTNIALISTDQVGILADLITST